MRTWGLRFGFCLFAIAIVTFFVSQSICLSIHGDAVSGKIVDGNYYVGYRGDYTHVSPGTYQFSYYYTIATDIMFAIGIVGILLMLPSLLPVNSFIKRTRGYGKRDVAVWSIGAFFGLLFGVILAHFLPPKLVTDEWRSMWWDVPIYAALGAGVAGGVRIAWAADRVPSEQRHASEDTGTTSVDAN